MIRPLIIDDQIKHRVAQVVAWASEHHFRPQEGDPPPGDDPRHVLLTDFGYRCVFSFTEGDGKLYRDLSVSVSHQGRYPNEFAFYTLAELFGFTGWDGATIVPLPEEWMVSKDIHFDAIRVAQRVK